MGLAQAFIQTCKQRKRGSKIADSLGIELSAGAVLMRALILRRLLLRHVLSDDERFVGLLLPPSVAGVLANAALALDRRVAVNLNYSVSADVINDSIQQAGIRHVLTSRAFMERIKFELNTELVYLDDFRTKAAWSDKLAGWFGAYVVPAPLLSRRLGLQHVSGDDLMTVIFTSGSTGQPKGVMLTESNVASNVDAIQQIIRLTRNDTLVGILPFFHSFGYTVTLWTVLTIDARGVYHYSPLEAKQIGKLIKKYRGTLLCATATFLRSYLRRCEVDELASLDTVVCGAEKLPSALCDAFAAKFGVRPIEGYGTTELSPVVSVNLPPSRALSAERMGCREGTVGRPLPGISAQIRDLDTGQVLGVNQSGMLWIKGPNVMQGYLNRPDLTDAVIRDGWYMTGDIGEIDADGFIRITARQSRFSKIGGEMVPHILVEEALARLVSTDDDEMFKVAVTAVRDERKGERLIVLHTKLDRSTEELRQGLAEAGLPNLFIPSADSFREVPELPVLGTGKLDLRGVKILAQEAFREADHE
jgi:acyl-[acyl-carrier-protein]-phospholipid O-acyltransferase / long-chain-fatty-acid--[acyl-carrier-protein] ligase